MTLLASFLHLIIESYDEFEFGTEFTPIDDKVFDEIPNFSEENIGPFSSIRLLNTNDYIRLEAPKDLMLMHTFSTDKKQAESTEITAQLDSTLEASVKRTPVFI